MADDRFFIPPPPPGTPKVEVPATPSPDAPRPIVPIGAPIESGTHRVPVRPPSPPAPPPAAAPAAEPPAAAPAPVEPPSAPGPPPEPAEPTPTEAAPVSVPAPAPAPASAPVTAESAVVRSLALVMPDGTRCPIGAAVVLGRDPVAPAAHPEARAVAVVDPAKSVSKTHALVVATPQGVEVQDLHSTNGVSVTRGGEHGDQREDLAAGARSSLGAGDRLALGLLELAVELAEG